MNRLATTLLLLCFVYSVSPQSQAQGLTLGTPPIHNYSKQDYQAETQNWAIQQTENGLLYFGNNLGLLEFDGTRWATYPLPNRSIVRSLATTQDGTLLIGGQGELGYFSESEGRFPSYHSLLPFLPESQRSFADVWKILSSSEGIFWGTYTGLFRMAGSLSNPSFEIIEAKDRFDNFFLCQDKILVAEANQGLKVYENGSLNMIPGGEFFRDKEVVAVLPHSFQGWLVLTRKKGMFHYQMDTILPWAEDLTSYLSDNQIYCGQILRNGEIAIGTSQNGVLLLSQDGKPLARFNLQSGILNNSVLSMYQDQHLNLWVGLENGLSYLEINSPLSWLNQSSGISGTAYAAELFRDTLYLGTNQGLYYRAWTEGGSPMDQQAFQLVRNTKNAIWGLTKINNQLLANQHQGAASIAKGRATSFSDQDGSWKFLELNRFPGFAIEGTYQGLNLYQWSQPEKTWRFVKKLEGFAESARVMEQDADGDIWISHAYRGVYRIKLGPEATSIVQLDTYGKKDGFPSDFSINVVSLSGELIFTTEQGIYHFDPATQRFAPHPSLNQRFGLSPPIYRLIEDQVGNIWYSTNDGFGSLFSTEGSDSLQQFSINRLQSRLVKGFEHIYPLDEQRMLIGTEEGFLLLDLKKARSQQHPFPVYLRKVEWMQQSDSVLFWGSANQTENPLSLPATHQDIRFSFSAAFFGDLADLQYQYRLLGLDEDWSPWIHKTEKEYTNLSPGEYTFEVRTRNIYGAQSKVARFTIEIAPPWYATIWAKAGYLLLLIIGILLLIRFNSHQIEERTEALQQENALALQQQEQEFRQEAQKSEAEIIRLRNERLEVEVEYKNRELAASAMHLLQKGEVLLKIKHELEHLSGETSASGRKQIQQLIRTIKDDIKLDNNWKQFEYHFDQVHGDFLQQLRMVYPELTAKDQRLCAYLKMNFTTKEIAQLMNISVRGVEISRYRLRKKLQLNRDQNLNEFMMSFEPDNHSVH